MIFVDTSAFAALQLPGDDHHLDALRWHEENSVALLTTDYVVDETLTLLRARGQPQRALAVGKSLMNESAAILYRLSDDDFNDAWQIFRDFADKQWSFTDCTSYVVTQRLAIDAAFTFDEHFRQFGHLTVVPA